MIYFISGHRDITKEEFEKYYESKINDVIKKDNEATFVIGDYYGVDKMAQDYLVSLGMEAKVTVYHMYNMPMRLNEKIKNTKGGYSDDIARDSAMTRESDFDIAFVREGKQDSGTAQNIRRRHGFKK